MSMDSIERGADREAKIAEEEYASGRISLAEYNRRIREIQREVLEEAREEAAQARRDYFGD